MWIAFIIEYLLGPNSLTSAMVLNDEKFKTEDIATILMDMLLIGVNTVNFEILIV